MSILVLIGLAILILGAGAWLVIALLEGAKNAGTGLAAALLDLLGRKRAGAKASIPESLRPGGAGLPKSDPERVALATYNPKPRLSIAAPRIDFIAPSSTAFAETDAADDSVDIDRIEELLMVDPELPYLPGLAVLEMDPAYPVAAPEPPAPIEAPPTWAPWNPVFADPAFDPPVWRGILKGLNRFVLAAYKEEFDRCQAARSRKAELLDMAAKRNQSLEQLESTARETFDRVRVKQERSFQDELKKFQADRLAYERDFKSELNSAKHLKRALEDSGAAGLAKRIEMSMRSMSLPRFVSREGATRVDAESGIVIHEHRFPDIASVQWTKLVELKSGWTLKPANQKERKEAAAKLYPSLCLRLAVEIARLDINGLVKAIAINGWADYTEKATGQQKRAFCASLFATKAQIDSLRLMALDPVEAFAALKGISSRGLDMVPIAPTVRLDTNDPRFIDPKDVLDHMAAGQNLAIMPWEDFEHLCRELFERAFADSGAEVKVTQASRDQGVDAVVFDPDPLRGGKIVIQAKRYSNTVDVSAVRDLYGAVINEGAVKGILVTTSHFGPEAYSFAKDKPLTLLNGNELLNLLERHGYKFRINLAEAKALL